MSRRCIKIVAVLVITLIGLDAIGFTMIGDDIWHMQVNKRLEISVNRIAVWWFWHQPTEVITTAIIFWPPRIQGDTMTDACSEYLRHGDWNDREEWLRLCKSPEHYWRFPP